MSQCLSQDTPEVMWITYNSGGSSSNGSSWTLFLCYWDHNPVCLTVSMLLMTIFFLLCSTILNFIPVSSWNSLFASDEPVPFADSIHSECGRHHETLTWKHFVALICPAVQVWTLWAPVHRLYEGYITAGSSLGRDITVCIHLHLSIKSARLGI